MIGPRRASWQGYVGISLVWLAVLAGVLWLTRRPPAQPVEILPPPTPAATATTITPQPLRIDVAGAVKAPAVYVLAPGSIVADAIAAAGGPAGDADLDRLNKAIELQDGMQVYVPRVVETPPVPLVNPSLAPTPAARAGPAVTLGELIDLNTASLVELESLPGIGPKYAQSIVAGRPYAQVEDLLRVKGIGPATLEMIKDLVTVR